MLMFVGGKRQLDVANRQLKKSLNALVSWINAIASAWHENPQRKGDFSVNKKNTFLSYQGGPEKKTINSVKWGPL